MPGCFIIVLGKLTYILAENWTLLELFLDVRTVEIEMLLYIVFSRSFVRSFFIPREPEMKSGRVFLWI